MLNTVDEIITGFEQALELERELGTRYVELPDPMRAQASMPEHQVPAPVTQSPIAGERLGGMPSPCHHPPTTNHQSPVTNHQSLVTNHQSPVTNHQSPVTNYQSPVTNYQPPITNHQPPITNHQPSVTNHQSPVTNHHSPVTNHTAPNTQHLTPNTQHLTPNIKHLTPNTQHLTPNTQPPTPSTQQTDFVFIVHQAPQGEAENIINKMIAAMGYTKDRIVLLTADRAFAEKPTARIYVVFGSEAFRTFAPGQRGALGLWTVVNEVPTIVTYSPTRILSYFGDDAEGLKSAKRQIWSDIKSALARIGKKPVR